MLPDLKTSAGFDALREVGYGFNNFDRPQNFKMQAEIVDLAIKSAGSLTAKPGIVIDTAYLVLDSLLNAPRGFEFFSRFPKEEVIQFCRLAVASREQQLPLPVVCPVCPDFTHGLGYQLNDGIDTSGELILANLDPLLGFFSKRSFGIQIDIHLADVEMFDQKVFEFSGETQEEFLAKTNRTIEKMRDVIQSLGLKEVVTVGSMMGIMATSNFSYLNRKATNVDGIKREKTSKKIRKTHEALVQERLRLSTAIGTITETDYSEIATEELADYSTYGDFINGQAVILSSDARSAVPAYNFLRTRHDEKTINPTIYLKKVKEKGGDLYTY